MPELIPYNRGMDRGRRQHYLKALGIDAWRLRASAPAEDVVVEDSVALAEPASPAVESPRATPRPAQTPTPALRPASVPQGDVPAAAVPEPPPIELPADWDGLRAVVRDCERCKLCATRTQTVFGVGQTSAPLMVVGEGPGADEDARGEPFVGRAGKLLDEMLAAIGRSRANEEAAKAVFIANVVKCRPPGNRDPQQDEVEACRPYLDRQIELVKPRLIVALGRIAAQRLLNTDEPLSRLRGPLHTYGPTNTPLLITYHPAYLLRSPREKAKSWEDLKAIHRYLAAST